MHVVLVELRVERRVPFLLGFTHHHHFSFMSSDLVFVEGAMILALLLVRIPLCLNGGDGEPDDERDEELLSEEELPRLGEDAGPWTLGHLQTRRSVDSVSRRTRFPLAQPRG